MFNYLRASLGALLLGVSFSASAALHSFADLTPEQLAKDVESGAWDDCSDLMAKERWCVDEFVYYKQHYMAELEFEARTVKLTLLAEYTSLRLTDLQRYLRQDGFELNSIQINDEAFDVDEQLRQHQIQGGVARVDKALILFLNRYPQDAPRRMVWRNATWLAELVSDGEVIELRLHSLE